MGVTIGYKGQTIASMDASGTKTLKTAGKYCEADILLNYRETLPSYRKYTGAITEDVVGSGAKALLLTSPDVAAHYADPTFKVAVTFMPNPETPYTVLQVTGYNVANQEPYRQSSMANAMQYTFREGNSVGSYTYNSIALAVSDTSNDGYVGRIRCDEQGHVYVWSGSVNYGVRRGDFVVEITW